MPTVLDQFRLDVAIVTGASSGLGVGFAQALAQAGADLVLTARREDRRSRRQGAVTVRAVISDPDDPNAVVAAAINEFGRVDILVNNAGVGTAVPATRETPEQFRAVMSTSTAAIGWPRRAGGS